MRQMGTTRTATNHGFAFFHRNFSGFTDTASLTGGATGLEPAIFGVTGRTKCNEINDSCKFFCG
jgi:hypothetical protein